MLRFYKGHKTTCKKCLQVSLKYGYFSNTDFRLKSNPSRNSI